MQSADTGNNMSYTWMMRLARGQEVYLEVTDGITFDLQKSVTQC